MLVFGKPIKSLTIYSRNLLFIIIVIIQLVDFYDGIVFCVRNKFVDSFWSATLYEVVNLIQFNVFGKYFFFPR